MARSVGNHLSLEMSLLCLTEMLLSFAVIDAMLGLSAVPEAVDFAAFASLPLRAEGIALAALLAFTIAATSITVGLYRPELCLRQRSLPIYAAVTGGLAFLAILLVSEGLRIRLSNRYLLWLFEVLLAWGACLLISRLAFAVALRRKLFVRPVVVVGSGQRATRLGAVIRAQRGKLFEHTGSVDPNGLDDLTTALGPRKPWGVVIAADDTDRLPLDRLLECKLKGVRVFEDVTFWEQHLGRIDLATMPPNWWLSADGLAASPFDAAARRCADICISLLFLALTLPLMLVVAAVIKLDSPGDVFYRQARVGLHGRVFTLLKFRSMRSDAEAGGKPRWASKNDPRITRIGAFIRATRIDELPQVINVLRGEMGFIGPRPERPLFVEELARVIPFYQDRSYVKPGITGWAQVNFPYGASVEDAREKLSYDLYYVKNRSLLLDLLILVSTVRVILFQEGAR